MEVDKLRGRDGWIELRAGMGKGVVNVRYVQVSLVHRAFSVLISQNLQ